MLMNEWDWWGEESFSWRWAQTKMLDPHIALTLKVFEIQTAEAGFHKGLFHFWLCCLHKTWGLMQELKYMGRKPNTSRPAF